MQLRLKWVAQFPKKMCSLPKPRMNVFLKPFIGLNTFENDFRGDQKKLSDLINPNHWI